MARSTPSRIHSYLSGAQVAERGAVTLTADQASAIINDPGAIRDIGIDIVGAMDSNDVARITDFFAEDDLTQLGLTTQSGIPVAFLQNWLPGFVRLMTAPRLIDQVIGVQTVGDWEDEEIIQGILEPTGLAVPYTDLGNIPLANWNMNYDRRTIVRFEAGLRVGKLEEARAAKARVNSAATKRAGAASALDYQRNRVGFFGYNGGANRTYGFLNDPNLSAYTTVANGTGGSPLWSSKSFLEITRDIRSFAAAIEIGSSGMIHPEGPNGTPTTLALPLAANQYLTVTSDFGISVQDWLTKTYPRMRVVPVLELNAANGGANVAYLFADRIEDGGDDGGATFVQAVPAKFFTIGTEQQAKAYVEDFGNALAGIFVKRPFAVKRFTGL